MESEWVDYRRALSAREQLAFDTLFRRVRAHASAASNVCRPDAFESVLISILLEHELEIAALKTRLAERARQGVVESV